MSLAVAEQQGNNLEQRALSIPDQVRQIIITSPETYLSMSDLYKTIRALREEVANTFDPQISQANKLHKSLIAEKNRHDGPLETGEKKAKEAMRIYDDEQIRIAREAENRIREEARKQEEERRLQEALAAEKDGEKELAEEIIKEPIWTPPVTVQKATPKVSGVVFRTYWMWRVKDINKVPRQYMTLNESLIGKIVSDKKNKEQAEAMIPGIEVYSERR
jgi:hypothetical protein